MAETVDELLVKLGLQVDAKGFKEADNQFSGLRTSALQAGIAIGGALLGAAAGLTKMSGEVAKSRTEFAGWAKAFGVNVQWADKVRHAMRAIGGTDMEAQGLIANVDNLREMAKWGELASKAFTAGGFNPQDIQSMNTEDATDFLSRGISSIQDADLQRRVMNALSFSSPNQQNLMADYGGFRSGMADAERLGVITDGIIAASEAYIKSIAGAETQLTSLKDMIAVELLPKMTEWVDGMTSWVNDHKKGASEAIRIVAGDGTAIQKASALARNEEVRGTAGSMAQAI